MLGSAQFVSPKPTLLPPAAPPAASGPHGGPSFMQIMNEQPAMVTPPHTEPVPGAPDDAPETPAAQAAPTSATTQSTAPRRKEASAPPPKAPGAAQPPAAAATPGDKPAAADASTDMSAADATQDVGDDAAKDADPTSSLTEFTQLIGLSMPSPGAAPIATASTAAPTLQALDADGQAAATDGAASAAAARIGAGGRGPRGLPGTDDTTAAPGARPTDLPDPKSATVDRRLTDTAVRGSEASRARVVDAAATADKAAQATRSVSSELVAAAARTPETATPRGLGAVDGAAPNFAAVLAQSMPTGLSTPDASPAPVSGQVHAAVHSPGFAPELAANVSLLAADGVQHAELQLNPADMGPVAVQIVVDGSQAQVSFHAVQADTRQALEQSLPDLAAALQGQGLTLSGGGVFQQARRDAQASDGEGGSNERSSRSAGTAGSRIAGAAGTAQVSIRRAAGLLDTFA